MKTTNFITKIAVGFCTILFIAGTLVIPATAQSSKTPPTTQNILNAIAQLQSTLNNMPQAWYQVLPSSERFLLVMGGQAVLDRETGLVWEQSPSTDTSKWSTAQFGNCSDRTVGNRKGWRLPTPQELASLLDPTVSGSGPTLPAGHPFSNVQSTAFTSYYWTNTSLTNSFGTFAWVVGFFDVNDPGNNGIVGLQVTDYNGGLTWCVRGESGAPYGSGVP